MKSTLQDQVRAKIGLIRIEIHHLEENLSQLENLLSEIQELEHRYDIETESGYRLMVEEIKKLG